MATAFFQRVEALCKDMGITTTDLAPAAGIGNGTLTGWRKGAVPSLSSVKKLAEFFEVSTAYLRCETDDPLDYANLDVSGFNIPLYDIILKKCKGNIAQANREYLEFEKEQAEEAMSDPDRHAIYQNNGGQVGVMGNSYAPIEINGKPRSLSEQEAEILRIFADLDTMGRAKVLLFAAELRGDRR